jgi:hypothetical protein
MLAMEAYSNFTRKDWVPAFVAHLVNNRSGIPLVLAPTDIETRYGADGMLHADGEFARCLRALVDQWIDSGVNADGYEETLNRNLNGTFLNSDVPLFNVLREWVGRNAKPALSTSGKITLFEPPVFTGLEPAPFGREHAIHWFMALLDCADAYRLARCNNPECRAYYVRLRVRKKKIKRGAFCGRCAGVASTVRTKASRQTQKSRLIVLAADVWPATWKPTRGYTHQSDWVVAQMKKKMTNAPLTITRKWISQNRKAIDTEVERRKNAMLPKERD